MRDIREPGSILLREGCANTVPWGAAGGGELERTEELDGFEFVYVNI